jgi:hypothetical protein
LWSASRVVSKTATVSLHGNSFEVDAALIGRSAELVFDPFDLTDIEVRYEGRSMGHVGSAREREFPVKLRVAREFPRRLRASGCADRPLHWTGLS